MRTEPAGRNMKRSVYAKNGSVSTHASGRRLRPDATSGRSASGAAWAVMLRPDLRRPLRRDRRLGSRLLSQACELRLRVERSRRKRVQQGLRQDLAIGQVVEPGRMREALEEQD